MKEFHDLQKHGVKQLKFKQERHIKKSNELGDKISMPGVCAALTFLWLSEKLNGGSGSFDYQPKEKKKHIDNILHATTVYKNAPNQKEYRDLDTGKVGIAEDTLASKYNLKIEWENSSREPAPTRDVLKHCETLSPGTGIYVIVGWIGDDRHRAAVYANPSGKVEFFDSNVGAYLIQAKNISKFFDAYLDSYNKFESNQNYTKGAWLIVKSASSRCILQ